MQKIDTKLKGCFILEPKIFEDSRGYFFESFNANTFKNITGLDIQFVQDNQASSTQNVVRGLHMQRPPFAQSKLVRVLQGKIIDIAVDTRKDSPTYGQSVAVELSDENQKQLFVPQGFLHGYSVISETAVVMYKCDQFYNRDSEDSVYPYDEQLSINWQIEEQLAELSEKDKMAQAFSNIKPVNI